MSNRPKAGLDIDQPNNLGEFQPRDKNENSANNSVTSVAKKKKLAQEIGKQTGFTSRITNGDKIDGRSLRATGRNTQLNMAVNDATKNKFWLLAKKSGYKAGAEFLDALMDHWLTKQ